MKWCLTDKGVINDKLEQVVETSLADKPDVVVMDGCWLRLYPVFSVVQNEVARQIRSIYYQ